jgi:hypothetical protein
MEKCAAQLERILRKNKLGNRNKLLLLLTKKEYERLNKNWQINQDLQDQGKEPKEFAPVVKLFNPNGVGSWYISELSPDLIGFGICHITDAELGYVSLDELEGLKLRIPIEKDRWFRASRRSLTECLELIQDGQRL